MQRVLESSLPRRFVDYTWGQIHDEWSAAVNDGAFCCYYNLPHFCVTEVFALMVCRCKNTQNWALVTWLQFAPKIVRYCNVDANLNHRTLNFRRSARCLHITCTLAFRPKLTPRKRQFNTSLSKNAPSPVHKYLEISAKSFSDKVLFQILNIFIKKDVIFCQLTN